MNSKAWDRLSLGQLTNLPRKSRYFRGYVSHAPSYKASISILRSWQHEESRRSSITCLQQNSILQLSGGYLDEFIKYSVSTVFPEDIGLANPGLIVELVNLYKEARNIVATLPLQREKTVERLVSMHLSVAREIAQSNKSRFVPSWAMISLLHHYKHWSKETSWSARLELLKQNIQQCREKRDLSLIDDLVRETMVSLEDCLLSIPLNSNSKITHGVPDTRICRFQLWDIIPKGIVTNAVHELNKNLGGLSRSLIYFSVLTACFKRENEEYKLSEEHSDLDQLFPANKPLPTVPSYIFNNYRNLNNYKLFQIEGICVPITKRWKDVENTKLSDEGFTARFAFENEHGLNASKGRQIKEKMMYRFITLKDTRSKRRLKQKVENLGIKRKKSDEKEVNLQLDFDVQAVQCVTSTRNKYIYLFKDKVTKGPYNPLKEDDVKRMNRNKSMYELVRKVDKERGLAYSVLPIGMETHKNRIYLTWSSIVNTKGITLDTKLTKNINRCTGIKRVSKLDHMQLSEHIVISALNHMYARYILGIGGNHLGNVLLCSDGNVFGIDLEEELRFDNFSETNVMKLLSSKRIRNIEDWIKRVHKIKTVSLTWTKENLPKGCLNRVRKMNELLKSLTYEC